MTFNFYLMKIDRKSTRLNSSHLVISYAVFCLKKKKTTCRRIHNVQSRLPRGRARSRVVVRCVLCVGSLRPITARSVVWFFLFFFFFFIRAGPPRISPLSPPPPLLT